MKVRDSGMPSQTSWETLFDVPSILDAFGFGPSTGDVAELGCGYGTFTVPLARRVGGAVHAFDIDPEMVAFTAQRVAAAGTRNLRTELRDVLVSGFGPVAGSFDSVLLFNILHMEAPTTLLRAAAQAIRPDGFVAIIHWRSDVLTPRGPPLDIRPRPEQIRGWAREAELTPGEVLTLPPWHFGLKLQVGKKRGSVDSAPSNRPPEL
jgi:SAM-dependent methyltransferase